MTAKELRIGNYLYLCGWYTKVVGVREDGVYVVNDLNTIFKSDITDVRPIPLTKRFFEKNGFIGCDEYGTHMRSADLHMEVFKTSGGWSVHIDDDHCITVFSKCIKYIHELQNAYYISTGKELEIKL